MGYVDGYVCPLAIQKLCFRSSLSVSDWSSWVQAIGSIAAIIAAIAVSYAQHRSAIAVALQVEIDRRELMSVRALLAAEGYLTGIRKYWNDISSFPPGQLRKARHVDSGATQVFLPMDLDSLAFLALEDAQEVLNGFSTINMRDRQWQFYKTSLQTAVFKTGVIHPEELDARVNDIESRTLEDLADLPALIRYLRNQLLSLHPSWNLPDIDRFAEAAA